MRNKFFMIGMVCTVIQMLMVAVLIVGGALEWWVLCWIAAAVVIATVIYQLVNIRCPHCGYGLAFTGKFRGGHCPGCGCEIK